MGFEDMPSSEFGLMVGFVSMTINLWDSLVQKIVSPIKINSNCEGSLFAMETVGS
jgi:hypothetical protein